MSSVQIINLWEYPCFYIGDDILLDEYNKTMISYVLDKYSGLTEADVIARLFILLEVLLWCWLELWLLLKFCALLNWLL